MQDSQNNSTCITWSKYGPSEGCANHNPLWFFLGVSGVIGFCLLVCLVSYMRHKCSTSKLALSFVDQNADGSSHQGDYEALIKEGAVDNENDL